MHTVHRTPPLNFRCLALACLVLTFACGGASAAAITATLSGAEEVPPVETSASGSAKFQLRADRSVSGYVRTKGIEGVAAHIHDGGPGVNGPVAIPLNKKNNNEWTIPVGTKFTTAQIESLKAGTLYVNVHTEAHKGGEIRGQLKQ